MCFTIMDELKLKAYANLLYKLKKKRNETIKAPMNMDYRKNSIWNLPNSLYT